MPDDDKTTAVEPVLEPAADATGLAGSASTPIVSEGAPSPVTVEVPVSITIDVVPKPFVCPFSEPQCNVVDGFCKHCGYTP